MNEFILTLKGPINDFESRFFEENDFDYSVSKSLTGGSEIIDVIIILSPFIIDKVTDIIKKSIENKRYIRIKHNGTEIENVKNSDELKEILDILFKNDKSTNAHRKSRTRTKNASR